MANFFLILLCLAGGFVLRRKNILPKSASQTLNTFIIYLSLPALVLVLLPPLLSSLTGEDPSTNVSWLSLTLALSMAWIQFGLAALFITLIGRRQNWSRATRGALILTAGLGNTAFVGFPLIEALYGPSALKTAVLIDQAGSFLVLATFGILVASLHAAPTRTETSTPGPTAAQIFGRIVRFPPFLALVAALVLPVVAQPILTWSQTWLEKIGATLVPLALVSVGTQLYVDPASAKRRAKPLSYGLVFKLVLAPLFFIVFYGALNTLFNGHANFADPTTRVTLLESAMAPMITAAIVASEFQLDQELSSLMVGVGIPISLFTVILWDQLLKFI